MNRRTLFAATATAAAGSITRVAPSHQAAPALAAPATPATSATPDTGEPTVILIDAVPTYLATAVVPTLPAVPVVLSLQRARLATESSLAMTGAVDAALLVAVEAGTVRIGAGSGLTAAGGNPAATPAAMADAAEVVVSAGAGFGGSLPETVLLLSPAPADLLIFRLDPVTPTAADPATPHPTAGADLTLLAVDRVETVPAGPALLEVLRFVFMPGGSVQLPEQSPATALIVVETGEMTVEMGAATTVHRAQPGAAARDETYAANTPFTVAVGQSMLGHAFAAVSAANAGPAPLSILMAVMQPAPPA